MDLSKPQARIEYLDGGRLRVAAEFVELLRANNLNTFEQVMVYGGGQMKRSVPGRSTVRIELNAPGGDRAVVFLKRYERDYLPPVRKLLRFLHWPGADDEAMHEWNAIAELRRHGFSTPTPIAVGQEKAAGSVLRSFLLTANIEEGVAAHNYAHTLTASPRRELAVEIARLTRRFLDAGFAHRDYYLSHIFVVESGTGQRELFLIDLQRVFQPRCFRRRWLVKDMASLGYTAQLAHATHADLLSFYKVCFGVKRLAPSDKSLIREIMVRVQALHSRGPRYDVIWDKPGERPPNV